jgi:hypothetical protein
MTTFGCWFHLYDIACTGVLTMSGGVLAEPEQQNPSRSSQALDQAIALLEIRSPVQDD